MNSEVLSKQDREEAIGSLKQYFAENMPEPLGDLPAGRLLDFFLEEVAPVVYNKAIADAQARMAVRVEDLGGELHADPFQYWARLEEKRKRPRR